MEKAFADLVREGLSIEWVLATAADDLEALMPSVHFCHKKAIYLRQATQMLVDNHSGKVPTRYKELLKLPGIGPNLARQVLAVADGRLCDINEGARRVCRRVGLCSTANATTATQQLQQTIPVEDWDKAVPALENLSQSLCLPVAPNCKSCPLRSSCQFALAAKHRPA